MIKVKQENSSREKLPKEETVLMKWFGLTDQNLIVQNTGITKAQQYQKGKNKKSIKEKTPRKKNPNRRSKKDYLEKDQKEEGST